MKKYLYFLIAIVVMIILVVSTEWGKELKNNFTYSLLQGPAKICADITAPSDDKNLILFKCLDENNQQIYKLTMPSGKEGKFWYYDGSANMIAKGEWSYVPRFNSKYSYCHKLPDNQDCPEYICASEILCQP